MAERIASMAMRMGCTGVPLTWHPTHLRDVLSEDNLAEAWLLMRLRAGTRISRTAATLIPALAERPAAGSTSARLRLTEGRCVKARKTSLSLGSWEYLWVPRETRGEGWDQGRTWIPHTHMVEGGWEVGDLHKVQIESEMPYSFREYLRQANNTRTRYSIGRAEIAVSGNKDDPQTKRLLGTLVDSFFEYAGLHQGGRPSHDSAA